MKKWIKRIILIVIVGLVIFAIFNKPEETKTYRTSQVEKGNIEYYSCSLCGKLFADSDGGRELSPSDVELPLSKDDHYLLEHVDAVKSTCNEKGNIEYWHCLGCENSYLDAECKEKVENVFLPL